MRARRKFEIAVAFLLIIATMTISGCLTFRQEGNIGFINRDSSDIYFGFRSGEEAFIKEDEEDLWEHSATMESKYWEMLEDQDRVVKPGEYVLSPAATNVRYGSLSTPLKITTIDPIIVCVGRPSTILGNYVYYPPGDGFSVMFSWDGKALKIDQTFQIKPENR